MEIEPARDAELDLAAVPAAIRRAGFTPADMELVAHGTFERSEEGIAFRVTGWRRTYRVRATAAPDGHDVALRARGELSGDDAELVPLAR